MAAQNRSRYRGLRMTFDEQRKYMNDGSEQSVSLWLGGLKDGDEEAALRLWGRYFEKVVGVARQRLGGTSRRDQDEEDVALSVMQSLYRGAEEGKFPDLRDRDSLWRLLLTITRQKAIDRTRRNSAQKRGGGEVRGESVFLKGDADSPAPGIDGFSRDSPDPAAVAELDEQYEYLLGLLRDDTMRRVAILRMEGHTNESIARELNSSIRSVIRKVNLIRETWARELS